MAVQDALLQLDREALRELVAQALAVAGLTPAHQGPLPEGSVAGMLRLLPREEGLAAKDIPVEAILHKVEMMRDKLRLVEQRINASDVGPERKLAAQESLTEAYRVLASVGVLLRVPADAAPPPNEEKP
jgi:hypothetical protein